MFITSPSPNSHPKTERALWKMEWEECKRAWCAGVRGHPSNGQAPERKSGVGERKGQAISGDENLAA